MVLTRKDFILRAEFLKTFKDTKIKEKLIKASIDEFTKSNPRFDEKRFRLFIKK